MDAATSKQEEAEFISTFDVVYDHLRRKDVQESFKLYNYVFDVRSLRLLNRGWRILSAPGFEQLGPISGRPIAVTGKYKVGKTFILSRLIGNDLLGRNQNVPTVGLSVIVPGTAKTDAPPDAAGDAKKKKRTDDSDSDSDDSEHETMATRLRARAKKNAFQWIVFDTSGSNEAVPPLLSTDQRATEVFLRNVAIALAGTSLYVVDRWDRDAQQTANALLDILQKRNGGARPAAAANVATNGLEAPQLNIVHNVLTVGSKKDLKLYKSKVLQSFGVVDEKKAPEIFDELDDEHPNETEVYKFGGCRHIFVVNEKTAGDDKWNPKQFNDIVFAALRKKLLSTTELVVNFDIKSAFADAATTQLDNFMLNWRNNYDVVAGQLNDGSDAFVCRRAVRDADVTAPSPASTTATDGSPTKKAPSVGAKTAAAAATTATAPAASSSSSSSSSNSAEQRFEPLPPDAPLLELNYLSFLEGGFVRRDNELRGNVRTIPKSGEKWFEITMNAGGLDDSDVGKHIRFEAHDIRNLFIVHIDTTHLKPEHSSGNLYYGRNRFLWSGKEQAAQTQTDEIHFSMCTKDDLKTPLSKMDEKSVFGYEIKNGMLVVLLKQRSDDQPQPDSTPKKSQKSNGNSTPKSTPAPTNGKPTKKELITGELSDGEQ